MAETLNDTVKFFKLKKIVDKSGNAKKGKGEVIELLTERALNLDNGNDSIRRIASVKSEKTIEKQLVPAGAGNGNGRAHSSLDSEDFETF